MRFKSIFIANLAEIARPLASMMKKSRRDYEIYEDHALCDRFVYSQIDSNLLVTPYSLNPDFQKDIYKTLSLNNSLSLSVKSVSESICDSILEDKALLKTLINIISAQRGVKLHSYAATPEFLNLVKYLRSKGLDFQTPELPEDSNLWTTTFFDSKAGFRQVSTLLSGHAMPEGFISKGFSEVFGISSYFFGRGRDCVLKTNRGLAGAGLMILKRQEIGEKNLENALKKLFRQSLFWEKELTVVEEFIEPNKDICGGAPNIELKIEKGKVKPLYVCGMRITPQGVFKGVELGRGAVSSKVTRMLYRYGESFGSVLNRFGYRGYFETDFVSGKDGSIYPIEANLRRTGGTHVYDLGKRVLGDDFLDNYYLVANNMQETRKFRGKSYAQLKKYVSTLLYPICGRKEGVLLTVVSLLARGQIGYVVVGNNKGRVYQIENDFLSAIS